MKIRKMKVEKESTDLSESITAVKQEKLQPNLVESYINLYDTSFVVCKEELCENHFEKVERETGDDEVNYALFPVTLKEIVGKCIDKCFSKSTKSKYLEKVRNMPRCNNNNCYCADSNLSICGTTTLGSSLAQLVRASNHKEENKRAESTNTSNLTRPVALETNQVHKNKNSHIINQLQAKSTIPLNRFVKKIRTPHRIENHKEALPQRATVIQPNVAPRITWNSDGCRDRLKEGTIDIESGITSLLREELEKGRRSDRKYIPCNTTDIESEREIHFSENLFYCNHCDYKSRSKGSLVRHMKFHTEVKSFSCYLGRYKCSEKSSLIYQNTHSGKRFSFNLCNPKSRQKDLDKNDAAEKPFVCSICRCKYRQKSNLINHMKTHALDKLFSCDNCSYKCNYKSRIVLHMQIHDDEKPFYSKVCHYTCKRKSSFIKHMKAHANTKPLPCKVCDFKAPCKSALVYHMKSHSKKLYSCNLCHYKFDRKCSLVYHMRTHTGERPFCCEVCGFMTSRQYYLNVHMKGHV